MENAMRKSTWVNFMDLDGLAAPPIIEDMLG
jgi:hypothetical protein